MTEVVAAKYTITRYEFLIPCARPAVVGAVNDALAMAEVAAAQHGVNTHCDDWLRVEARDDAIVFFFDVKEKAHD